MTTAPLDSKKYALPARNLFDLVALNDLPRLLTVVRGTNPFDISPGLKLILEKMVVRPETPNPYVAWTDELDMEEGKKIRDVQDDQGNTLVHLAAHLGHIKVLQMLVEECDCDIHVFNKSGFTPFHLAVMSGRLECIKLLLQHDADPLELTKIDAPEMLLAGRTTMFLAHWKKHHAVTNFLEDYFGLDKGRLGIKAHLQMRAAMAAAAENEGKEADKVEKHIESASRTPSPPQLEPPFATLTSAARIGNVFCFAKVFDFVDCMNSVVGTLNLRGAEELVCHLRTAVPHLLPLLIPKEIQMPPEKLFIFRGLLERSFIKIPSDVLEPNHAVELMLRRGQLEGFRMLCEAGIEIDNGFSLIVSKEDWGENLRILLLEVEVRQAFEEAMNAYKKKHHSRPLREKARYAKKRLFCIQKELEKRQLKPLVLPRSRPVATSPLPLL